MKGEKLSPKEEEFCRQYVTLRNGTKAAVAAGYKEKNAAVTACENLKKPKIASRIGELEAEWRANSEISQEQIVAELKAIAFSNIQDDFLPTDEDPQHYLPFGEEVIRALPARPRHVTASIKGVRITRKGEVEITRYDKVAALSKLAEIMGIKSGADMNVNVSIADGLAEAAERYSAYEKSRAREGAA